MLLARIKQLREELNIQQRQMADAIGVDAPMYSRIERGIRPFRDEYIAPMAKILKIDKDVRGEKRSVSICGRSENE